MGKTDYIVIQNAKFEKIAADNAEKADEKYKEKNPGATNLLIVPRKAAYFNRKKIKP